MRRAKAQSVAATDAPSKKRGRGVAPALPSDSAPGWEPAIAALAELCQCKLLDVRSLALLPSIQADAVSANYADLGESLLRVLGTSFELHRAIEHAQMTPAESAIGVCALCVAFLPLAASAFPLTQRLATNATRSKASGLSKCCQLAGSLRSMQVCLFTVAS